VGSLLTLGSIAQGVEATASLPLSSLKAIRPGVGRRAGHADGRLLVADDLAGAICRISCHGIR